jgi:MYXO-CTERM domain-containing protein
MVPQLVHASDPHILLRFSPDGRTLASVHRGRIYLWDLTTSALLRILEQPGAVQFHDIRFLADGKRLLTANYDLSITTWDLETGSPIRIAPGTTFGGPGLVFSSDAKRALWLELDSYLRVADLTPNGRALVPKLLHTVGGTGPKGVTVALTQKLPPAGTLIGADISKTGNVGVIARGVGPPEVWNLDRGELVCKLAKDTPLGSKFALSPDGERLVTAHSNGSLRVWSSKRCAVLRELTRPPEPIRRIAITPDGRRALVLDAKQAALVDIETGKVERSLALPQSNLITDAGFSEDGRTAALGGTGVLDVWDLGTGSVRSLTRDKAVLFALQSVAFDATGRRAASATFEVKSPAIAVWDLDRLGLSAVAPLDAGTSSTVVLASRSPRAWSISGFDKRLRAWDMGPLFSARSSGGGAASPALLAAFDGSQGEAGLAVSSLGRNALTVSTRAAPQTAGGKTIYKVEVDLGLWGDDKSSKKVGTQKDSGRALALSSDGRFAATARYDAAAKQEDVMLWDLERGILLHAIAGNTLYVWSAAFSPDGKFLVFNGILPGSFGESQIRFINVATGAVARTIKGPFTAAQSMTFSDDGKKLAARFGDRVTRVWSTDTGALITERALEGHTNYVSSTAFSRDGRYLLTGTNDGLLRLHRLDKNASVTLIARGEDWLVYSEDGYFDASRRGGSLVAATSGLRPFLVDQLAVRNNRPDILLDRMGLGTPELIEHYRLRYERRLKKLNIKGDPAGASFEKAPEAKIVELAERGGAAEVTFDIEGVGADLLRYNVFVNDVPIFGAIGKETSGRKKRVTERVELSAGRNKIEVSALDADGAESLRAFRIVTRDAKEPGNLYYIGFGVSNYKNPKYNLGYPHKDILDVGEVLKAAKGSFRDVKVATFVNEQVTVDAVRGAKEILAGAGVNDTVVLFVAGHGLHAPGPLADYYFATYEVDVKRLPETAASFELIEDLLQGIAPRKKLFLMDTCESGEEADGQAGAGMQALAGSAERGLRARTTRALTLDVSVEVKAKEPAPVPIRAHLFDRDRYVYNDLSRRSGAIVLSSSRGSELSWELDELQNGVFSEAILIALTSDKADADKDGQVSVDELRAFVAGEVPKRTQDRQHPTVDRDNLEVRFSFPVLKEAASIVTRADPTRMASQGSLSRDVDSTPGAPQAKEPAAPPKTPTPPGCGCELPGESNKNKTLNVAAPLAAIAALAAVRRRRRARRSPP